MDIIKVIIWGIDDVNTLGLVREVGEIGIEFLFLLKGSKAAAARSKYVKNLHQVSSNEDALEYLTSTFNGYEFKPVIITSGDGTTVLIDQHKEELEKLFVIPGTSIKGLAEKYTDKNNMTSLAIEVGIKCPESRYVQWDSSIDGVKYPCFIKPSHQKPGYYNEFKFKICNSQEDLQNTLSNSRHESEFILQDYIKSDYEIVVFGARMMDGVTCIAGAIIRDRLAVGISGHGMVTPDIPSCIDVSQIATFLEKIDYRGLFGFEYGVMADEAYFYEVNLRNDGTAHCFYNAGSKLTEAYILSCMGKDYGHLQIEVTEEKWFIDELYDYGNVLEGKITRKQWKKDMKEATIMRYYDANDVAPYKYLRKRKWINIAKYILLGKYRQQIVAVLDKLGLKK